MTIKIIKVHSDCLLHDVFIVDQKSMRSASTEQLNELFDQSSTRCTRVVDNAEQFFSRKNLIDTVMSGEVDDLEILLAYHNVPFTADDISAVVELRARRDDLLSRIPPTPYSFLPVPPNYVLTDLYKFNSKAIVTVSGGYSITYARAEQVWNAAARQWTLDESFNDDLFIPASGFRSNRVRISNTSVKIGCQEIPQLDVEQIALKMGWKIPTE